MRATLADAKASRIRPKITVTSVREAPGSVGVTGFTEVIYRMVPPMEPDQMSSGLRRWHDRELKRQIRKFKVK